jgi:hypothetical protein
MIRPKIDWDVVFVDLAVTSSSARRSVIHSGRRNTWWTSAGVPSPSRREVHRAIRATGRGWAIFTGPFIENYLFGLWHNAESPGAPVAVKERGMTFDDFAGYRRSAAAQRGARTAVAFLKTRVVEPDRRARTPLRRTMTLPRRWRRH